MSQGLGRVQVAVLDYLHARRGDDHIGGLGEPLFILGPVSYTHLTLPTNREV